MADLVVIVPSRGRPEAAAELIETFRETCTADTYLVFAVDEDDPTRTEYARATGDEGPTRTIFTPSHTMVESLNHAARWVLESAADVFAVGFLGDDHRPRTKGWDTEYLDALRDLGSGIVYANDGFQGERLPTQCAMTADIIRVLGFMAPPGLRHMYVDDFWRVLGSQADRLIYLPDVLIEHMHPAAGKADWSEGHKRVNAREVYADDEKAFAAYVTQSMPGAVAAVKALADVDHEWRLFDEGTIPEYTQPDWYAGRDRAPHLEEEGHRERLQLTARLINEHATTTKLRTLSDLGAGDGGLMSLLDPSIKAWGYDLQASNLDGAIERGVDVRHGDVVSGDIDWGQIVVATEMLEHLVDPHEFVRRIAGFAEVLVCSSPWQERAGKAYEFHTWAWDPVGYRALVEQGGFTVLRHEFSGPFQIILAVRR